MHFVKLPILKNIIYNDDNLCLKKGELKEKTLDAIFSLPIKIPNPLLKKRIPDSDSKIGRNLGGFRIADSDFDGQPYFIYIDIYLNKAKNTWLINILPV